MKCEKTNLFVRKVRVLIRSCLKAVCLMCTTSHNFLEDNNLYYSSHIFGNDNEHNLMLRKLKLDIHLENIFELILWNLIWVSRKYSFKYNLF